MKVDAIGRTYHVNCMTCRLKSGWEFGNLRI
jgi:hypothetical protein